VQDLNRVYSGERALYECDFEGTGFQWVDCNDSDNSVVSFVRRSHDGSEMVMAILNFTPVARDGYRIGVPVAGAYVELINSDADCYGGANLGNYGGVETQDVPWHNQPQSAEVTLPPLGVLYLLPE